MYRIGSRKSALAMYQSERVRTLLEGIAACEIRGFATQGDDQTISLSSAGSAGIFVTALRAALLNAEADLIVHSLKDLPTYAHEGIVLAAVPERVDPHDVFVGRDGASIDELPEGSVIGTSSPRRSVWVKQLRPDLEVRPIRGNVETRLRKVQDGEYAGTVLAAAGLQRLGLLVADMHPIPFEELTPAPGQAALAVECRSDDTSLISALTQIDDIAARLCVSVERAVVRTLGATCATAAGAYAELDENGFLRLTADVASSETTEQIRIEVTADIDSVAAAEELGAHVARLLIDDGAYELIGMR